MFEYNYNRKNKGMYVNLPLQLTFDYEFHDAVSEMIDKCLLNNENDVKCVYVTCDHDSKYDKMSMAYLLNVLRYIMIFKDVKWHFHVANIIAPTVHVQDGAKFREVNFDEELQKNKLIYYDFHGDKNVQKPVDEMAKLLVEKNLTINSETVKEFLSTTIGEIFSNSINHSEQDEIFFMYDISFEDGDFYLCINVIDYGSTIVANVKKYLAMEYMGLNGTDCIRWAIKSGNTTRLGSGGYGLPTLISYIKSTGGELYILSGEANYKLSAGIEEVLLSKGVFCGTSITFKVKLYDTGRIIKCDKKSEKIESISLDSI